MDIKVRNTLLAALRYYQRGMEINDIPDSILDIAVDHGDLPLTVDEIDELCEELNGGAPSYVFRLTEGDDINEIFAARDEQGYIWYFDTRAQAEKATSETARVCGTKFGKIVRLIPGE